MKNSHVMFTSGSALALLLAAATAQAVSVDALLTDLGGGSFKYTYTIDNSAGLEAVQGFQVDFDPSLYDEASLQAPGAITDPAGWSSLFLGSVPLFAPATVDWCSDITGLCDGAPLAIGASATGFMVTFDWLGAGTPGSQPFRFYNANFVDIPLDPTGNPEGETIVRIDTGGGGPAAVPEPGTLALYGMGIGLIGWLRRRLV